jgi:2-polyprenyl-6-methoxyphenol hydroxylase-like FAD-dependent oxidoreductase
VKPRALVIGGSLGGLFAAHLLRSVGWDAVVFERIGEDLASRGVGIGTHDALAALMDRIGVPSEAMGVEVRSSICLDHSGRIARKIPIFRIMSSWSSYYRPLREALPPECYRPGMSLVRVEQNAKGVVAIFADGTRAEGDLLVGADGIRSTVREQYQSAAQPAYAGYVAWRAVAEEAELPASFRPIFDCYCFCLPEREMSLSYPVPGRDGGTRKGQRGYNVVWYRPADLASELPRLCTDASGRCHGMAIPPPLIRPEIVAEAREAARAKLAPAIAEIVLHTPQPFFQAIFDLETPRLVFGRVALLGDAAFVARPHVGAGVTKAAVDAAALADAVAQENTLDAALARYERLQCGLGTAIVARGRRLGAYLEGLAPSRDTLEVMREHSAKIKFTHEPAGGRRSGQLLPDTRIDYYYD